MKKMNPVHAEVKKMFNSNNSTLIHLVEAHEFSNRDTCSCNLEYRLKQIHRLSQTVRELIQEAMTEELI